MCDAAVVSPPQVKEVTPVCPACPLFLLRSSTWRKESQEPTEAADFLASPDPEVIIYYYDFCSPPFISPSSLNFDLLFLTLLIKFHFALAVLLLSVQTPCGGNLSHV